MVPTMVNEAGPFPFAIDTGAWRTVISPGLATRLGIESTVSAPMMGGGGRIPASAGRVDALEVGNARVENLTVMVADFLVALSGAIDTPLEGIIGYNFLSEFTVTIDYPRETLRMVPRG